MARLKPVGDQVVVVMGASSGIGREAARCFAAAGARVVASAPLSPRALDLLLARVGFAAQRSRQPPSDRDALFEPVEGLDQAEGGFGHLAFRRSASTWAATHRAASAGLLVAGAAAVRRLLAARSS